MAKIVYTHTDEAPLLATYSFLPIIQAYAGVCGVDVETRDISLAGRILALFPDHLTDAQRVPDALAELGQWALDPSANIIKLPNISASMPQLKAAIKELQGKGYALPDYPDDPATDADRDVKARYDKVKGSAVNPVLREGNSDRRAPASVKAYARKHPHSMGAWSADSKTHVASMSGGDFFGNEQSVTVPEATDVRIEHVGADGAVTVLKASTKLKAGEIIDGTYMSRKALVKFYEDEVAKAREEGVLLSLHLKATMMKVSDPILFGHAVKVYFADMFAQYGEALAAVGADPNNGLGAVIEAAGKLPADQRDAVLAAIEAAYAKGPDLAMVDSDKGITNL
ncbi:MAG: NADP-dependent isocitrate dehydrogenase, partial [Ilumatobacter sp.]|nr:NADP-dependent isocitrate dehydrogenase [Ilumatobacter sp.]